MLPSPAKTYKKEFGEDKTLEDLNNSFKNGGTFLIVSYFENKLLSSSEVGKNIKEHKRIETKTGKRKNTIFDSIPDLMKQEMNLTRVQKTMKQLLSHRYCCLW